MRLRAGVARSRYPSGFPGRIWISHPDKVAQEAAGRCSLDRAWPPRSGTARGGMLRCRGRTTTRVCTPSGIAALLGSALRRGRAAFPIAGEDRGTGSGVVPNARARVGSTNTQPYRSLGPSEWGERAVVTPPGYRLPTNSTRIRAPHPKSWDDCATRRASPTDTTGTRRDGARWPRWGESMRDRLLPSSRARHRLDSVRSPPGGCRPTRRAPG